VLLQRELVTRQQLDEALAHQRVGGRRLGEVLLSMGVLTQEQLCWALSESLHIPFVELSDDVIDLDVTRSLPEAVLRRHEAVPGVAGVSNEMTVAPGRPERTARPRSSSKRSPAPASPWPGLARGRAALPRSRASRNRSARQDNRSGGTNGNGHGSPVVDLTGVSQVFALLLGSRPGPRERATSRAGA
jgi:hypothetical protein